MTKRLISTIITLVMALSFIPAFPVQAASTISVGQYVQMGSYYGEPILWRCVDIDENGPLMLSDKIISIKPFDAKGTHKYMDGTTQADTNNWRTGYGSNLWETSNMRSWLNSTATAGNVTWPDGCPPTATNLWSGYNAYDQEKGFLADGNFTASERNVIKSVTQKSLLNSVDVTKLKVGGTANHTYSATISTVVQNYDTAYYHNVTDKMFLLDVKQLDKVYQKRTTLGTNYYIGQPTQKAVDNYSYKDSGLGVGKNWFYWLRSPYADSNFPNYVRIVSADGIVYINLAYNDYVKGVRPAFYINLSSVIFKSGNGSSGAPFVVSGGAGNYVPIKSISLPSITNMNVGDYITLSPTISPSNGSMQGLKWSSYNPNIAVVSNGIVDGLCPGSTLITATTTDGSNISASCVVTVNSVANYSDSGTDALRKLALSNFVYNNLDNYRGVFVKDYPINKSENMFNANGEFIKWDKLYKQTIYNHKILATSDDSAFSSYIDNIFPLTNPNNMAYKEIINTSGFYAAAFKDENGQIIIAFRGTNEFWDVLQDIYAANSKVPTQCIVGRLFYDYVKNIFNTNNIQVTGHSLGGAVSDFVSMVDNVPSISFNGATGWIFKDTYMNYWNTMKDFKGIGPNDWGFKRCINIDSQNVGDNAFNVAVALTNFEYTNDYLMNGNGYGYDNSLACYSHSLQSMLHYDNGTGRFSISNSSVVSPAKNPWKMDNLYLGISGDDTLTVETGFLNQKEASTLYTGNGNDTVYGGNRNDTIYAVGSGHKDLYGGLGNDKYVLDADVMDSEVNISDPGGTDEILLKGNIDINTYNILSDGTRYVLHLGGNKVIKVNVNRGGSSSIRIYDVYGRSRAFVYGGIIMYGGGEGPIANILPTKDIIEEPTDNSMKNIRLGGEVSVSVYDTNNQLLGIYSNDATKVEIANWGYFYSFNDSTGKYMNIDIINGNYVLKVNSTGSIDYSVYDPDASTGGNVVYEQKGIDLSDGSQLVINSDFVAAINKFSISKDGNTTPLNAEGYVNAQQINLGLAGVSLVAGTSATVSAIILPNNAVTKSVNWTIIQPEGAPPTAGVVTNTDGTATVTGLRTGTATLCATATDEGGVNTQIPITVTQANEPTVTATADGGSYLSDTITSANTVTVSATLPSGFDTLYISSKGTTMAASSIAIINEGETDISVYATNSITNEKTKTAEFIVKIDRTAPTLSGVTNAQTYYIDKLVTAGDFFINNVTINGTTVFTLDELSSGKWFSQAGSYSLNAADQSGKSTTEDFTILPLPGISTLKAEDLATVQSIRTEFEGQKYSLPIDRQIYFETKISALESRMTLLLNDGFNYVISDISSSGSQLTVKVLGLSGATASQGILVLLNYDGEEKPLGIKTQPFVNGQEQYVFNLDISKAYRIKALLWEALTNIKPISSARTVFVDSGVVVTPPPEPTATPTPTPNIKLIVNGKLLTPNQPPVIIGTKTMVPFPDIMVELGYNYNYDALSGLATSSNGVDTITLTVGSVTAYKNTQSITLITPPVIINAVVMVPIKLISDATGVSNSWNPSTNTISFYQK